ncbi:hypothetical protein [Streptomyces varsoviensis]|uniref:hypothetical protein n=1 Tax=Streptomyces varsoviensis TaxID=67373 RepID=UPI0012FECCAE|nr:hypothetical protein [Streptomyces varsoviensis]
MLHYEIITDPTTLQASLPGEPSVGTVYILVSNNHQAPVTWDHIDVELPIVPGATELTSNPGAVNPSINRTRLSPRDDDLEFKWDSDKQVFRAQIDRGQNPNGATTTLYPQQGLILTLGDIAVSEDAGLVVLEIHEVAGGGDGPTPLRTQAFTTALGLTTQTPRVPRNFRAEKSLVNGEANETLALLWDGPTGLDYAILDQRGAEVYSESPNQGLPSFHKEFAWRPPFAPKRGTTYTLVAKAPGVADQRGISSRPPCTRPFPSSRAVRALRGPRGWGTTKAVSSSLRRAWTSRRRTTPRWAGCGRRRPTWIRSSRGWFRAVRTTPAGSLSRTGA